MNTKWDNAYSLLVDRISVSILQTFNSEVAEFRISPVWSNNKLMVFLII